MALTITDWRVSPPLLDTSDPNAAEYPIVFGIQGRVAGRAEDDGWVGLSREDDGTRWRTFATFLEAQAEVDRLRAKLPNPAGEEPAQTGAGA